MNFFKKILIQIVAVSFGVVVVVFAGTWVPTASPDQTMVTLEDIYQKVLDRNYEAGSHNISTSSTPSASMHSLWDIYEAIAAEPSSSGGVPYIGASDNVDLGIYNLTANRIKSLDTYSGSNWEFSGDYNADQTGFAIAEGQFYDPMTNDSVLGQISLRDMDTGTYGGMSLSGSNFSDPNNQDKLMFFSSAGNGIEFQNRVDTSPTRFTGASGYFFDSQVNITDLAGSGNAYVCVDSTGKIYRSATSCI